MNPTVTAQFALPDPITDNPLTFTEVVQKFNLLSLDEAISGGPFSAFVLSNTTPAVSDQDKVWFQTDGNGRPLAIKLFYSGNWRPFYRGKPQGVELFRGNPATYFDGTHLGIIGSEYDGYALCTATGASNWGVPNLSDLFVVGGNAYGTSWKSKVQDGATLLQTGGIIAYQIKNTDLPNMQVFVTGFNQGSGTSGLAALVDNDHGNRAGTAAQASATFGADASGTPPQTLVPTVPPYYSLAYIAFVGYVT